MSITALYHARLGRSVDAGIAGVIGQIGADDGGVLGRRRRRQKVKEAGGGLAIDEVDLEGAQPAPPLVTRPVLVAEHERLQVPQPDLVPRLFDHV